MNTADLLAGLVRQGFALTTEGNDIRVRPASRLTPELRRLIRCHKAELVSALKPSPARGGLRGDLNSSTPATVPVRTADLPAHCLETWEERAAIAEFDGCLTREQAEAQALRDLARPAV
jgi:hypothetical protein